MVHATLTVLHTATPVLVPALDTTAVESDILHVIIVVATHILAVKIDEVSTTVVGRVVHLVVYMFARELTWAAPVLITKNRIEGQS